MSRWFRFYDDALNDPKVQRLPGDVFKGWVNILCLASRNDGWLPPIEDIGFALRMNDDAAGELLQELSDRGLLDEWDGKYAPHNWQGRQHKSDISTDRVREHRKHKAETNVKRDETVSRNGNETPQNRTETDTEAETEQKDIRAVGKPTRPPAEPLFLAFREAYPKRDGANPWQPARKKFLALVKAGNDPDEMIAAAGRYADEIREKGHERTPLVAQAITWLNQERFRDYPPKTASPAAVEAPEGAPSDDELRARYAGKAQNRPETTSLLRSGDGLDQGEEASGAGQGFGVSDHSARHSGVRSLGRVLQATGGYAFRDEAGAPRRDATGDGPRPLARVV